MTCRNPRLRIQKNFSLVYSHEFHDMNTMINRSFFMRPLFICSFLTVILCLAFSGCASTPAEKTENGNLEATITVPPGLTLKDVRECVGHAFIARHYQNIEITDGKISGTYKNSDAEIKLTAIYSTTEIKLYGKNITALGPQPPYAYPQRWIEGVRRDTAVFLARKVLEQ